MPRMDGSGPWWGFGPGTGRGLGPCGAGRQRGWGLDWGRFRSPKNQLQALADEEKVLEEELAAVKEEKKALQSQK